MRYEPEEVSAKIEKHTAELYSESTMSETQKLAVDLDKSNIVVEPLMKKPKLVPEECELFVDIDSEGACSFEVISKIESSFDSTRLQLTETLNNSNGPVVKDVAAGFNNSSTSLTDMKEMPFSNTVPFFTRLGDEKCNANKLERVLDNDPDSEVAMPAISSYVALDCEFVGVRNDQSALGRCSIVDYHGNIVCDIYARPTDPITTYRTRWSGITRTHMSRAIPIESALSQISDIIQDKIVVGHAIHNDFRVLGLKHPWARTRDTSRIPLLSNKLGKKEKPSLKVLAKAHLDQDIQNGSHCSVVDAQVAMELYKLVRVEWETSLLNKKQPFGNKEDKDCDNVCEESRNGERDDNTMSENPENGPTVNKMSEFNKVKKQNNLTNLYKLHFGQIVNSSKSVEDYFIDRKNGKSGMKHSQSCQLLPSMLSSEKLHSLATFKTNISDKKSNVHLPNCSSFNADNQPQPSRKRSLQGDFVTNGIKNTYQKTVKQLFRDEFWPEFQQ